MFFMKRTKFWQVALIIILALSLLPMLLIAQYNHSSADDYGSGLNARLAFLQTHNPFEIVKAVFAKIQSSYVSWQGTYSAIAIFALQPAVFGEQYYFISTFVLLAFFLFGTFAFFRSWIGITYGRKDIADIIACCVSLISIQMLPSAVQGFFWWNGSTFYVVWHGLMLIQASRMIKLLHMQKSSPVYVVITALLGFLIAGSNYITALLIVEITAFFLFYCIYQRRTWRAAAVILFFTLIGFFTNVLAPGNAVRQEYFQALSPLRAILKSLPEAVKYIQAWTSPILFTLLLFIAPFALALESNIKSNQRELPIWISIPLLLCLFASSFTPTLYSGQGVGAERVQNIRFFLWILICFIMECFVIHETGNLLERINHRFVFGKLKQWFTPIRATVFYCLIGIATVFLVLSSIHNDGRDSFTSISAAYSLRTNEAQEYDSVADRRIQILLSDEKHVVLEPFAYKPYVLFFDDIREDPADWRNVDMAEFFQKESVTLQSEE